MKNLKIFRAFVWGIVFVNSLWANFYLGVEGGYLRNGSIYIYEDNSGKTTTGREPNWRKNVVGNGGIINLVLGTEHFFAQDYVGVRWGISGGYGYTQSRGKVDKLGNVDVNLSTFMAGVNADILINFYATQNLMTGFFVGAEYGFTLLSPNKKVELGERKTSTAPKEDMLVGNQTYSNEAILRVGLSTRMQRHHRIELFAKLPLWTQKHSQHFVMDSNLNNGTKDDRKYTFKYEYLQVLLSYKYVF